MGFLDNLFKKEARKIISSVVDNVVDTVVDTIKENADEKDRYNSSTTRSNYTTTANPDEEDCCYDPSVIQKRVEQIVAQEWAGYELRKNISALEMRASTDAMDYTYGLYLDGNPKAMIMVLEGRNTYKRKSVRLAHDACKKCGVFCMNLLLHMPNRSSYISKMLKDNVGR